MRIFIIFFLWAHVIVLTLSQTDQHSEDVIRGQGLYLETHQRFPRKIGPPTQFGESGKATDQLLEYLQNSNGKEVPLLTDTAGIPIGDITNSLTVGPRGPMLLQDTVYINEIAHFDRERIPERVVHAKGAGAFGYFEVTHDITQYCKASVFSRIGKVTPIAVRFSSVIGESGSADTVRDPRGFAVKFYTDQGNWDLTGNNTPVFFIRDALMFPQFIHSQKRNPVTHLKDANTFWDFITLRHETLHQIMIVFSDRGIPNGFRHMHGYGSHTFKMVNDQGEPIYCKFHYKTNQGIEGLDTELAEKIAGSQPDYGLRDLYEAISAGDYPSWNFYIQVMTFKEAEVFRWNPFDLTKIWPQKEFPLIPVGRFILNRNPTNYFAEIEQMSFNPANMPPGIEPSPDKMLQGRLFAYHDTARYRLGPNFEQLPVNRPLVRVTNFESDGPMTYIYNQDGQPNYYPNSFGGPMDHSFYLQSKFQVTSPDVARFNSSNEDNYSQPTLMWTKVLKNDERQRMIHNVAIHLINAMDFIQERAVKMFTKVHVDFGQGLAKALQALKSAKAF